MKRLLALAMCLLLAAAPLTGCKENEEEVSSGAGSDYAFNEVGNTVDDSSEMPDWDGKRFDLKLWYAQGTASAKRSKTAENDVVSNEVYRITGVRFDEEESFDNGGESMDSRIAKIMASGDWPDIVCQPERAILEKMIEADMVYDLTELIPKYCPNIVAAINAGGRERLKSDRSDGRLYSIPVATNLKVTGQDIDPNTLARVRTPVDYHDYVYVRDDVLRAIYPEAKTQDDIEKIYVENGKFTEEEVYDVPIYTKEEFFEFLRKVKALNLKEGNYDVFPTYVADGYDNWSLFTNFGSLYGYGMGKRVGANYFTYWDKETKNVEYMFKQPEFKAAMKDWTTMVQDGVASADSLLDNRAAFEEKVYNGVYAVLYGSTLPDLNMINSALEKSGKDYNYRKVFLQIDPNEDKYLFSESDTIDVGYAILKSQVKEEDLPQILRFLDFAVSAAGQKLIYWGPKTAGLWTEENGKRKFVDKALEDDMVYGSGSEERVKYNLADSAWPGYIGFESRYDPRIIYDMERTESTANKFFSSGIVRPVTLVTANAPDIWLFDGCGVKNVQKFWQARQSFEDAVKKVLIAKNDAEFEDLYSALVKLAENNGLTDETLVELNKVYREQINADYMSELE